MNTPAGRSQRPGRTHPSFVLTPCPAGPACTAPRRPGRSPRSRAV